MYLEISMVGSGKTTRLIKAVEKWLDGVGNTAVIICNKFDAATKLWRRIPEQLRSRVSIATDMMAISSDAIKDPKACIFVDEFDSIDQNKLSIIKSAYYVTTPKRKRKVTERGFLDYLIDANEGEYTSYAYLGDLRQYRQQVGEAVYDLDIALNWKEIK